MEMKIKLALQTLVVLFCSISSSLGRRLVFLPMIVSSHEMMYQLVAQELSLLGHDVWMGVSSAFQRRLKPNSTSAINFFSFDTFVDETEDNILLNINESLQAANGDEPDWSWVGEYAHLINNAYLRAMSEKGLLGFVRKLNPDLIVIDFYPRVNELVAIPYALGVPFAVLSTLYDATVARQPFNPLEDAMNALNFRNSNSLYERLGTLLGVMYPLFYDTYDTSYVAKIAPDKPLIKTVDILCKAEIFIIESDHILDYPRPLLPNVKFVGGITSRPANPLLEPFKTFMDDSHVGVAVVSFGTLLTNLPNKTTAKMLDVFERMNVNIVWKTDIISPFPKRLLTSSWIPQNDLLAHVNTKLFISHCGAHGQMEAVYHGVPVVCLPIFFDQNYNAERFKAKKFGLSANIWTDSVDTLLRLILEVMDGDEYRQSISKASEIYHQLYKNPRKEAAFWIDHVMAYGGSYMRSNTQQVPIYQFTSVYFLFIAIGALVTVLLIAISCVILTACFYINKRKERHLKKD